MNGVIMAQVVKALDRADDAAEEFHSRIVDAITKTYTELHDGYNSNKPPMALPPARGGPSPRR